MADHTEDNIGEEQRVSPEIKACVFSVGERVFSLPIENLLEIAELEDVAPLPLSPDYIDGIAHHRGEAIPVLNLETVFGIEENASLHRWLLIVRIGGELVGLSLNNMPDLSYDFSGEVIDPYRFFESYRIR